MADIHGNHYGQLTPEDRGDGGFDNEEEEQAYRAREQAYSARWNQLEETLANQCELPF